MRRRGDLTPGKVDKGWPFQVAVRCIAGQNLGHVNACGPLSSLCWKRHHVVDGRHNYEIFCFGDKAQADLFRDNIRGEHFDPRDRVGWRWDRGRGARRDEKRRQRGY